MAGGVLAELDTEEEVGRGGNGEGVGGRLRAVAETDEVDERLAIRRALWRAPGVAEMNILGVMAQIVRRNRQKANFLPA